MARTVAREYFVIRAYMFTTTRHVEKSSTIVRQRKSFGTLQLTALWDVRLVLLGIQTLLSSRIQHQVVWKIEINALEYVLPLSAGNLQWRQQVPSKNWLLSTRLPYVTSQKSESAVGHSWVGIYLLFRCLFIYSFIYLLDQLYQFFGFVTSNGVWYIRLYKGEGTVYEGIDGK